MAQDKSDKYVEETMQRHYDSIDKDLLSIAKREQPAATTERDFRDIAERAFVSIPYLEKRFTELTKKGDIDPLLKDTKRKGDRGGRSAMLVGGQAKLDRNNSGSIDANDFKMLRSSKAEGGEMDQQMDMLMGMEQEQTMLPDEEMEEDYVDYVVEETLSNEDRNYLIDALEKDDRLSMIFDQVVESATEFTGSGTVEGPGTGRSDSIPARLSDGEFVITAKATDEIGSDNLMSMMKDAEAAANERQSVAYGGMVEDEGDPKAIPIQTTGSQTAQGNIPRVAEPNRKVDEEMLKASPRRYYVPLSG
jgi:DNA-binding Lrp family transcriptional regulator